MARWFERLGRCARRAGEHGLDRLVSRPRTVLAAAGIVVGMLGLGATRYQVEASANSLLLQDDPALHEYRAIAARYDASAPLVLTYAPDAALFTPSTLARIGALRDALAALPQVAGVTSLLDVPLLQSPPLTLADLRGAPRTLRSPEVDLALARQELTTSPLYADLLVDRAGRLTAMQLQLREDTDTRAGGSAGRELAAIDAVREVVARHRDAATVRLAGAPLIAADIVRMVQGDQRVFGAAVAAAIVVLLGLLFRRVHWVVLAAGICAAAGLGMVGLLGWLDWRASVVSANFLPVLLVATLSLVVHLIVRYEELQAADPDAPLRDRVRKTMRSKLAPSLYTVLTTIVAFASLAVSGIQPVIDFGWMLAVGVGLGFVLTIVTFPAGVMVLAPAGAAARRKDPIARVAERLAIAVMARPVPVVVVALGLGLAAAAGTARLDVENRFIDYFDESTAIHQGMLTLDRDLGGTMPLDVIVDADPAPGAGDAPRDWWFDVFRIDRIEALHQDLARQPAAGKVLSLATTFALLRQLNHGQALNPLVLALARQRMPDAVREQLLTPYLSPDGRQIRLSVRVRESVPGFRAHRFIERLRSDFAAAHGLDPGQVRLSGLLVLYDNVLQSLYRSQAQTAGFVLAAVLAMFALHFRSLVVAALALVPNLLVALLVLGAMGWLGISLDIMTVTIAALVLGIAVDDTIHYVHRYLAERPGGHRQAVRRSHGGVGRAIAITTLLIAIGFGIFTLSAFVPLLVFGAMTALAMVAALLANLTLLPLLLGVARRRTEAIAR